MPAAAAIGSPAVSSLLPSPRIALRWRILISVGLALHVAAVFLGPWSMPASRPSRLVSEMAEGVRVYLNAAYLNHGYRFFAPNPGPSHIVRYELTLADGSQVTGRFPDLQTQQPRLFYHRHFMLSETLAAMFVPEPPIGAPAEVHRARELYKGYERAFAAHLLRRYQAEEITLTLEEHLIRDEQQVRLGFVADDPKSYVTMAALTLTRSELAP